MPTRSSVEHGGSCLMSGVKSESSPYASRRTLVVEDYLLVCLSLTLICDCALFATGPTISDKNLQEVLRDDASLWCLTIGRVAQLAPISYALLAQLATQRTSHTWSRKRSYQIQCELRNERSLSGAGHCSLYNDCYQVTDRQPPDQAIYC
jgi:hypothetical protein